MNKNHLFIVLATAVIGVGFYMNQSKPAPADADEQVMAEESALTSPLTDGDYTVNPNSAVSWEGSKTLIADYTDKGTLGIKMGSATVKNGAVTEGALTFDMSAIKVASTGKGKGESGLEKHLKSADFFDVEHFPAATFALKSLKDNVVTGDLTIKDVTHEISFPAKIGMNGKDLAVKATLTLDRTLWNLRYGSDQFFDNLGDKVINDTIKISFDVSASPL